MSGDLRGVPNAIALSQATIRNIEQKLLALWRDRERTSSTVKTVTLAQVAGLKETIAERQAMAQTLEHLADHGHGNDRPDYPIIADFAGPTAAAEQHSEAPHGTPRFGVDTPASSRNRAAKAIHSRAVVNAHKLSRPHSQPRRVGSLRSPSFHGPIKRGGDFAIGVEEKNSPESIPLRHAFKPDSNRTQQSTGAASVEKQRVA